MACGDPLTHRSSQPNPQVLSRFSSHRSRNFHHDVDDVLVPATYAAAFSSALSVRHLFQPTGSPRIAIVASKKTSFSCSGAASKARLSRRQAFRYPGRMPFCTADTSGWPPNTPTQKAIRKRDRYVNRYNLCGDPPQTTRCNQRMGATKFVDRVLRWLFYFRRPLEPPGVGQICCDTRARAVDQESAGERKNRKDVLSVAHVFERLYGILLFNVEKRYGAR